MEPKDMCDYDFLNYARSQFTDEEWDRLCDLLENDYDDLGWED